MKAVSSPPSCQPRTSKFKIIRFFGEAQLRWTLNPSKKQVGQWMKEELTNLGPAFIKLGQFLSTRPDILGKEAVAELSKLQDDISPSGFEEMEWIINNSLNKPWQEVFSVIEPVSIASASIGQVYKAVLKNGVPVVIKVQKPCVARQIKDDLDSLKDLNDFFGRLGNPRSMEVDNILSQYARFLSSELDYNKEIAHMKLFRDKMTTLPVHIPYVYQEYSSPSMIVMEYVASTKITDIDELKKKDINTQRVAEMLVELFLYQIVYLGTIHCDPHPGNVGVSSDGETIVLYDFGNVVELSSEFRKELNTLVFTIVQKDVDEFVDLLCKLDILELEQDTDILDIKEFFRVFFNYLESQDFNTLKTALLQQQVQGGGDVNIRVNPDFLSLFRVFSLLDGTCAKLDPNFNYIEVLRPFTTTMFRDTEFMRVRAQKDVDKVRNVPVAMKAMENKITRLQSRIMKMGGSMQQMQYLALFWLWVDHQENVWPWIISSGMMFWWLYGAGKFTRK
jgi:predicted unusual protein kinase regulating ubiquinone biosynthesis (AarF/ABC1/UbiB family)